MGGAKDARHRGERFAPEGIRLKGGLVSGERGKIRGGVRSGGHCTPEFWRTRRHNTLPLEGCERTQWTG